jgi:hypothetical protein
MQLLKIFLPLLLLASCSRQSAPPAVSVAGKPDTVFLPAECPPAVADLTTDLFQCQMLLENTTAERDSIVMLAGKTDSLYAKLLVANYKLERVRFYSDIVRKNPSQVKFLRGWINRVLGE